MRKNLSYLCEFYLKRPEGRKECTEDMRKCKESAKIKPEWLFIPVGGAPGHLVDMFYDKYPQWRQLWKALYVDRLSYRDIMETKSEQKHYYFVGEFSPLSKKNMSLTKALKSEKHFFARKLDRLYEKMSRRKKIMVLAHIGGGTGSHLFPEIIKFYSTQRHRENFFYCFVVIEPFYPAVPREHFTENISHGINNTVKEWRKMKNHSALFYFDRNVFSRQETFSEYFSALLAMLIHFPQEGLDAFKNRENILFLHPEIAEKDLVSFSAKNFDKVEQITSFTNDKDSISNAVAGIIRKYNKDLSPEFLKAGFPSEVGFAGCSVVGGEGIMPRKTSGKEKKDRSSEYLREISAFVNQSLSLRDSIKKLLHTSVSKFRVSGCRLIISEEFLQDIDRLKEELDFSNTDILSNIDRNRLFICYGDTSLRAKKEFGIFNEANKQLGVIEFYGTRSGMGKKGEILLLTMRSLFGMAFSRYIQYVNSITDGLTGIPRREYILRKIEEYVDKYKKGESEGDICVAMIDIDRFKHVNDTYGHSAGDKVLKQLGDTIRANIRSEKDMVGRYGGEEFIIVFPGVDLHKAEEIAERLRQSVERTKVAVAKAKKGVSITISIGVTSLKNLKSRSKSVATLIASADKNLYAAKRAGRNRLISR